MSPAPGRQPVWIPNTNVFISSSGHLIVQVELSSLRSDDLEITIEGRRLRIVGHRRNSEFAAAKTILVHEMHTGPFESVLELPPEFDLTHAKASYLNGVLSIVFPAGGFRGTSITFD
jgi:HSP20 family molecular chaperone IbpA